jgi:Cu(I)/Ag(I) efflux system membrane fusion protein
MKNYKIYFIGLLALAVGFLAAWFIKPDNSASSSNINQTTPHNHSDENKTESDEQIWTCSMHPQIRQNEPGLCPICEMDLIPLEQNTSDDPLVLQMTNEAAKLSNVQTITVGETSSTADKIIQLSGKVKPDERLASSQVAHIPGRIEKLHITFTGEQVTNGQKIATIFSPELVTAQRELIESFKLRDINPGLVEAARNKLKYWKLSETVIKNIEENATIQETFPIYADASGIVTKRRISVGDYVQRGQALFDIMSLRKVWVLFDAYEEDIPNFSIGSTVEFSTPSIPDKTFKSKITFIDPLIDPQSRVVRVRTEVSNSSGKLKPEMLVYGTIQKKTFTSNVLTIPRSAVLWTGKRSVAYIKVPDSEIPSFQFREIELGERMGDHYVVLEGIDSGEEVVVNGNFAIDAAAQLNNQASMMNRNVKMKKEGKVELPNFREATPEEFRAQLAALAKNYLTLKDAFVQTNAQSASENARLMMEKLEEVNMSLLKGDAHMYWMDQLSAIQNHGDKVSKIQDIESQRKQFNFLTDALVNSLKAFGVSDDTFYIQYCPMAFNNKGADWISDVKEIRNPYFGDKMMKCGVVKDTLTRFVIN